ncbi:TetR/AcrR family transcriptional regulator [Nocardia sp. alder85J]|uniref:TetR/AcrR family transcriptional regulator n=1 Tax=Nocardia sp. alder85J TaxID=2862949 RepID=UPI001CD29891|nr:TetR/AcrR family transcriptional regulator [Nocardia sp. alder85J]MCX4095842.1 TetR/AcrR family transcriptional regulator [Nocardia sp. alder85J]
MSEPADSEISEPKKARAAVGAGSARRGRRAEQIARAAGYLFQTQGYQNVSIDQIGAAVGLTGPAVYRHFKGKHDILVSALMRQVRVVEELGERMDTAETAARPRLDLYLAGLGDLTANQDEATLWRREQRHLEPTQQQWFRHHYTTVHDRIAGYIANARPEISAYQARLLGYAVLTMYSNTGDIRGGLAAPRLLEIQTAVATAMVDCDLPEPAADARSAPQLIHHRPAGRRERILAAAVGLFEERGFYDVRIDDIASAAEISVATLYQHVTGKAEVLRAILDRGAEGLLYVTADALAHTTTPQQTLDALIRSYTRQALGIHGPIMRILAADLIYLDTAEQSALRDTQRDYVAEWVQAILALSGTSTAEDARALAHAAIGVLTDISQHPELRARPGIFEELAVLGRAITQPPLLRR